MPRLFHFLSKGHQLPGPSDILPLVPRLGPLSQGCICYDSLAHFQKEKVDFDQDFDQGEEGELENKWMGSLSWGLTTKVEKVRTSKEKKNRRMENMEIAKCMVR